MCFGPAVSFTSSGILASIGVLVLKNIRSRKELVFAAFPVIFSLQQLIEGILWLAIKNDKPPVYTNAMAVVYLAIAYSLWPIFCPLSVYAIEYKNLRKRILRLFLSAGVAISSYLLWAIITAPVEVKILNCSLHYKTYVTEAHLFAWIYAGVTILPYFISSHKTILIFGVPNFIFCIIAYIFYAHAFISTWCFFAAILSLTLFVFLRKLHHQPVLPLNLIPPAMPIKGKKPIRKKHRAAFGG